MGSARDRWLGALCFCRHDVIFMDNGLIPPSLIIIIIYLLFRYISRETKEETKEIRGNGFVMKDKIFSEKEDSLRRMVEEAERVSKILKEQDKSR